MYHFRLQSRLQQRTEAQTTTADSSSSPSAASSRINIIRQLYISILFARWFPITNLTAPDPQLEASTISETFSSFVTSNQQRALVTEDDKGGYGIYKASRSFLKLKFKLLLIFKHFFVVRQARLTLSIELQPHQ